MRLTYIRFICVRLLCVTELLLLVWFYVCGVRGFDQLYQTRDACEQIAACIAQKELEVAHVQQELIVWNTHAFHKEKIAREQLQMARKDEVLYLLP